MPVSNEIRFGMVLFNIMAVIRNFQKNTVKMGA